MTEEAGRSGRGRLGAVATACDRGCRGILSLCHVLLRVVAVVVVLLAIGFGMLVYELRKGPVPLPGIAPAAAALFNDAADQAVMLEVGGAYLALTRRGRPALRFRDVRVWDRESGELLIAVPRLGARFALADLMQGKVAPTGVTVIEPRARILRLADGRFRFGIGFGTPVTDDDAEQGGAVAYASGDTNEAGFAAISSLIDSFAGLGERPAGTERLRRVVIRDAQVFLRNAATGSNYRTQGADFALVINEEGIRADAVLPVLDGAGNATDILLSGRRAAGSRDTVLTTRFAGLRLDGLARELPELGWLAPLAAPVAGRVSGIVPADGRIGAIETALDVDAGSVLLGGDLPPVPIESARLVAGYDPEAGRLALEVFEISGPKISARLFGSVEIETGEKGGIERVLADLRLADLGLDLPGRLAEPARFDTGALALSAEPETGRIRIADVMLARAGTVIQGRGEIDLSSGGEMPASALRFTAKGLNVGDVKALWPIGAGGNARPWFVENIRAGRLPELVAEILLEPEREALSLDFAFEDVVSTYLGDMPAIEGGHGKAHLTLDSFDLALDSGHVDVPGAGRIDIAGSSIRIYDFDKPITPADVALEAEGGVAAVLALIDRPPLGLVSKLGLPLGEVAGQADVRADLSFPLLADLAVEEVAADAEATLGNVALTLPLGDPPVPVTAGRLTLAADTERLALSGKVGAFGTTFDMAWTERYGAVEGRELTLSGSIGRTLLARFGVPTDALGETAFPFSARLSQEGGAPLGMTMEADLTPVSIDPPIAWSKRPGEPGKLNLAVTSGDSIAVETVRLEAGDLSLDGSVSMGPDGAFLGATVSRLTIGAQADITLAAEPDGAGGYALRIGGRKLDAALFETDAEGGAERQDDGNGAIPIDGSFGKIPLAVRFDLDRLTLADGVDVAPAAGNIRYEPVSGVRMDFAGRINASAPASGTLDLPQRGDGRITLRSEDAGAFLRALDLASEAQGGALDIEATLEGGGFETISGTATAQRLQLTEGSTVQRIFVEGGAAEVLEADEKVGGVSFRRVEVPFSYDGERITVKDAVATGPALAIRISGLINQREGTVAMSGVASPAYAVSGFLNNIPLLGRVLTGDRGEGLLGLTFKVTGSIEDPDVSVNPLSLLAPGILRNLFESDPTTDRTGGKKGERRPPALIDEFGSND